MPNQQSLFYSNKAILAEVTRSTLSPAGTHSSSLESRASSLIASREEYFSMLTPIVTH